MRSRVTIELGGGRTHHVKRVVRCQRKTGHLAHTWYGEPLDQWTGWIMLNREVVTVYRYKRRGEYDTWYNEWANDTY